jgi:hypothetical protein
MVKKRRPSIVKESADGLREVARVVVRLSTFQKTLQARPRRVFLTV